MLALAAFVIKGFKILRFWNHGVLTDIAAVKVTPTLTLPLERGGNNIPVTFAIESIKKNRRGVTLGKNLSLKKLIEEGRR